LSQHRLTSWLVFRLKAPRRLWGMHCHHHCWRRMGKLSTGGKASDTSLQKGYTYIQKQWSLGPLSKRSLKIIVNGLVLTIFCEHHSKMPCWERLVFAPYISRCGQYLVLSEKDYFSRIQHRIPTSSNAYQIK
jgi:hypothetical protein